MLLPVAIGQLLLWRSGFRNHSQRLSDDEEAILYEKGKELASKVDFVVTILRIRELMSKANRKTVDGNVLRAALPGSVGGTRSRPRPA